ncbi:uncharacterized protein LOC143243995 [Tachypleus tridentatus]|uniref:uncharacterized protein LOC143243995 n=1 Tax=Tachypleus tridentatus TaxID=6853 RepID=UPI003FD421A7
MLMERMNSVQKDFFLKRHTYQEDKNGSFRMFYYPPVGDIKHPNVACLGEQTDFRTITFLFQDDSGGMELKTKSGEWIQATPIKGTVILLVADLMSIWSNGLYPATLKTKSREWIQATPIKSGSCFRLAVRLEESTISSNSVWFKPRDLDDSFGTI